MRIAAWIASVVLGALAILLVDEYLTWAQLPPGPSPVVFYGLPASLLAAAVLLFPPFWRRETAKHLIWARVIAAFILAGVGLFTPIPTHAIKLDMPAPSSDTP